MKRDYYEVLGVERTTDQQEIKRAYRRMAVKYHPDKNKGDKEAEERFKEAAEAYSVLSNAEKRARYDRFGHAGLGQTGGGIDPDIFADFGDILGDFFGFGDIFGGRRQGGGRGSDLRYDLTVSFEEAAFGMKTKLKIPRRVACESCKGSGADARYGSTTCTTCGGRGQVAYQQGFFTISRTCSQCRGAGQVIKHSCPECRGAGRKHEEKVLEVKIPAGVDNGSRLRISGEGEAGADGRRPGDLYVDISIQEHPFFKRHDHNVLCEVPISFATAALGGEIKVRTLDGEETVKVPSATQTGSIFRLRGRGIPSLNGRGRGDQMVQVTVVTPTKLSSEQRDLLVKLSEISGEERGEGTFFEKVREFFG